MNLPALQAQSRLQSDIKATKTIAFTVAAYFACYVPTIAYAVAGQQDGSDANSWFSFFVWLALFFSSAMNPIIYYVRSRRFRCAFKQFIKDPFGSSALQEKSSGKAREKRNPEGAAIPWENGNEEGDGYHRDEDQAIKNYHGQRRDGIMILSMQALQSHLCAIDNGGSSGEGRVKQQKGKAPGSTSSFPEPVQREACVSNHQIYDGGSSSRGEGRAKQQKGEASGTTRSFPEPVIEQREACASNPQIKEPIEDMCEEIQEFSLADNASLKERNLPRELAGTSGYRPEEKQEIPAQCLEEEIAVAYRPQQVSSGVDIQESAKDTPRIAVDKFLEALEERDKIA